MRGRRRLRGLVLDLVVLLATLGVFAVVLELGFRVFGPAQGDWYAVGPARVEFLRRHVQRNRDGFRDREFPPTRTPGVERILAVGDSFTFGDGIRKVEDAWPRVLEEELRAGGLPSEVFNLGIPGTNTSFQRRMLLERGFRLGPDRIVLGFALNDPEPPGTNREIVPRRLYLPLLPWASLDSRLTRSSHAYAWVRGKKNLLLERLGRKETYEDFVRSLYREGPDWDAFVREAEGLVAEARARDVPVTVVIFPMFHELERYGFDREHALAAEVFRRAGADVVDLLPAFRGRETATLRVSPADAHPGEKAHRLAAEAIARHLLEGSR